MRLDKIDQLLLDRLRVALQSSWAPDTAYQGLTQDENPAYAQCYPTARVVQFYLPQTEILQGVV